MKKAILATKVGMTQIFSEDGTITPVTVLQAGPCVVTQVKTVENDGYSAVQVGFKDIREKLVNKPVKGQFDKAGLPYKRFIREFNHGGVYSTLILYKNVKLNSVTKDELRQHIQNLSIIWNIHQFLMKRLEFIMLLVLRCMKMLC